MNETRRGRGAARRSPPRRRSRRWRAATARRCATRRRWRTSCPGRARLAIGCVRAGVAVPVRVTRTSRRGRPRSPRTSQDRGEPGAPRERPRAGDAGRRGRCPRHPAIGRADGLPHRDPRRSRPTMGGESALTPDARVREALWRERARLRRPPLTADAALDALARDAAEPMRGADAPDPGDLGDAGARRPRRSPRWTCSWRARPRRRSARATCRTRGSGGSAWAWRRVTAGATGRGRLWIAVIYTD